MNFLQQFTQQSVKQVKSILHKARHPLKEQEFASHMVLFDFTNKDTIGKFLVGCDADTKPDSTSVCKLEYKNGCAHFHGDLDENGYAIMRSKLPAASIFGRLGFDVSKFTMLEIEAKSEDDHQYFLSLRSDLISSDFVHQTKLQLPKNDDFQTIQIPFADFILTHKGAIMQSQSPLNDDNLQTVGLSMIKSTGKFSTYIRKISVFNPLAKQYKDRSNTIGHLVFGMDSKAKNTNK